MSKSGIDILKSLLESKSQAEKNLLLRKISKDLNLAIGTVKRWLELDNVPEQYYFDMMKLAEIEIDYSSFSAKQKDQFFTPTCTAKHCVEKSYSILTSLGESIPELVFIEPSAGSGAFLEHLPTSQTLAMDIEPRSEQVFRKDFLSFSPSLPSSKKIVLIGNPPFGLRGNLALRFMNHASQFADYICFILPQLFESDGKGAPRKRVKGLHLYHSETLETGFHCPDGRLIPVNTIFQVWSKHHVNEELLTSDKKSEKVRVYSLSLGSSPSQIRNKDMIGRCDVYLPSTCFGKERMRAYSSFEDLPGKKGYGLVFLKGDIEGLRRKALELNWSEKAFLSTNSALNLRTSMINKVIDLL
jgi:hypothetical protein